MAEYHRINRIRPLIQAADSLPDRLLAEQLMTLIAIEEHLKGMAEALNVLAYSIAHPLRVVETDETGYEGTD